MESGNYANGSVIDFLNNLDLTRIEAEAFQPILEQLIPFGGYPNAYVQIENSKQLLKILFVIISFKFINLLRSD